ncbi:non-ribosomal peptide synthetase [Ruminiclostridium papyrosolvens]|uniref:Thioester reductase n=1 Tax=Ruminiclostridium papyrosolvens C7 TaxID=1330534 RepID=U4R3I1_9FIRM|nr:non-ribosomal peptide synthetase [Ruminiclostridium papyrosolvens]EPR12948.1 thioester reductase [Ruminiclostridium papyrosolvens C7]
MNEKIDEAALSLKEFVDAKQYWIDKLSGSASKVYLPYDLVKEDNNSEKRHYKSNLSQETSQRLLSAGKGNDLALYVILLGALKVLLYRYTGQNDIVIGSPVFVQGEQKHLTNKLIALRDNVDDGLTFAALLREIKETLTYGYKNQHYPVSKLMEIINGENVEATFFSIVLTLSSIHNETIAFDMPDSFNNDLIISVQKGEQIQVNVHYNSGKYKICTIKRFVEHYKHVLDQVLTDMGTNISELELVTKEEKEHLLYRLNDTGAQYPKNVTVHKIFEEQAAKNPDRTAVIFNNRHITYNELDLTANKLANFLVKQQNFKPDSFVGILMDRSEHLVTAALGVLKAGGAYVPINNEFPEERIKAIINDAGIRVVIISKDYQELLSRIGPQCKTLEACLCLDNTLEAGNSTGVIQFYGVEALEKYGSNPLTTEVSPENTAYVIYTSGTTGMPKGVLISHKNVVRLLINDSFQFDFNHNDVWTMFHSFSFDFSVWEMYGALLYGGKLVIAPRTVAADPKEYLELLKKERVTVLNQTPTAFSNLINEELDKSESQLHIRYVIFGGEALKPAMLKDWRRKYPNTKLVNMYGITETTVHVTYKEITEKEIESNQSNIGKPIPTLTAYIMDKNMKLLPCGVPGELCVGGDGVSHGYLNRQELTADKFVMNPYKPNERLYKSGDLARMLPDGEMEYIGRIDHQVKIRGHRIELGEIESKLLKHPGIKEAIALVVEDSENNKNICAYYMGNKDLTAANLREYLATELPGYMIPSYFIGMEKFPLTQNGKIDKKALPSPKGNFTTGSEYEPPRNDLELKLAEVWQSVLEVEKVGIRENFFTLGGDSIKAISLVSKINNVFCTDLYIRDLYSNQTIGEMALLIANGEKPKTESDLMNGLIIVEKAKEEILADKSLVSKLPDGWEDIYPLSRIQQGMVFYSKSKPEEPIYHDQFPFMIKFKKFDLDIYRQSLQVISKKHPVLRTGFNIEDFNQPVQIVYKELIPDVTANDITNLKKCQQEEKIKNYMSEDLRNRFKFQNELLWRVKLFKLDDEHYYIITTIHHAILDGWSVASFNTEFINVYNDLIEGKQIELNSLKFSYKDFVAINTARKSSKETNDFWKGVLEGYSRNKLPFNYSGKKISNINQSKKCLVNIGTELLDRLEKQGKINNCTVKDICISAYIYLLMLTTTENDIVTGVVSHERPAVEDSEKALGCFLITVPMRIKADKNVSKLKLLQMVKAYQLNAKPHEMFLGDIANATGVTDRTGNPIFDTIFNFTDFHVLKGIYTNEGKAATEAGYGLTLSPNEMTNTLFDLEVSKSLENFSVWIKYSQKYFYEEDIRNALKIYIRLLEEYANDGDYPLNSVGYLSQEDKKLLIYDFNNTVSEYPKHKTIHMLFEEQVKRTPENIALVQNEKKLTYRELNEKSNKIAWELIQRGVKSGDHVGIIAQRGFGMIAGMLAILKAGGAYIPIDPDYPSTRIEFILNNSDVTTVVADSEYGLAVNKIIRIDTLDYSRFSEENLCIEKNSQDLAYVIYTSGSTGTPKGVMIEHHSAVNLINWVNTKYNVTERDTLLFVTSMCFDLSVYDVFGILASGGRIVIARKEQVQSMENLGRILKKERITFWDSVPSTMNYLINTLEEDEISFTQTDLRLVFLSGDWIPVKLPERVNKFFPKADVISLGGATEGTIWSIYYPIKEVGQFQTSIPYGMPLDNNFFYILDENKNPVPKGVAGELYIGGVGVARGYINRPELTTERFIPDPFVSEIRNPYSSNMLMMYRTGDYGRMMSDGNIEFLGRVDHQVKIRGFRVELGEIESLLLKHEAIREAVVADRETKTGDKYLCAYIVTHEDCSAGTLREFLSQDLPDYMIPSYFVRLQSIPLTSNGKIDRKALPEPETVMETTEEYEAPRNELEEKLLSVWQDILGTPNLGINNNFFDAGGDSIKAMQVISGLKKIGFVLEIRDIFSHQTIKEVSSCVRVKSKKAINHTVTGEIALIPTQKGFFRKTRTDINHWNLSIMLYKKDGFDEKLVEKVFTKILEHHDALRIVFKLDGDRVTQFNRGIDEKLFELRVMDCTGHLDDTKIMDDEIYAINSSMNLEKGPLVKLGLFKRDDGDHLLLVIHHLVWDGLSMMVILEDFATAYRQLVNNEEIRLPEKTSSFKEWSERINLYANSEDLLQELEFWKEMESKTVLPLPKDYFSTENTRKDDETISVDILTEEKTGILFKEANKKHETEVKDILATAFGASIKEWTGQNNVLIDYKIHGREDIFEKIDVTRTVGWFATEYPMVLDMSYSEDLTAQLISIRDTFRKVPGRGLGYETLRDITLLEHKKSLKFNLNPEILFNFSGDFDTNMNLIFGDFSMSPLNKAFNESPNSERKYTLIIEMAVVTGKLYITVHYNKHEYIKETMLKLIDSFKTNLIKLIDKCTLF